MSDRTFHYGLTHTFTGKRGSGTIQLQAGANEQLNINSGDILIDTTPITEFFENTIGNNVDDTTMTDVNITSLTDDDILRFDSANNEWYNTPMPDPIDNVIGNNTTATTMEDVTITSLTDQDQLKFDSTSNKWVNFDNTQYLGSVPNNTTLGDVEMTEASLGSNYIIRYNADTDKWNEKQWQYTIADATFPVVKFDDHYINLRLYNWSLDPVKIREVKYMVGGTNLLQTQNHTLHYFGADGRPLDYSGNNTLANVTDGNDTTFFEMAGSDAGAYPRALLINFETQQPAPQTIDVLTTNDATYNPNDLRVGVFTGFLSEALEVSETYEATISNTDSGDITYSLFGPAPWNDTDKQWVGDFRQHVRFTEGQTFKTVTNLLKPISKVTITGWNGDGVASLRYLYLKRLKILKNDNTEYVPADFGNQYLNTANHTQRTTSDVATIGAPDGFDNDLDNLLVDAGYVGGHTGHAPVLMLSTEQEDLIPRRIAVTPQEITDTDYSYGMSYYCDDLYLGSTTVNTTSSQPEEIFDLKFTGTVCVIGVTGFYRISAHLASTYFTDPFFTVFVQKPDYRWFKIGNTFPANSDHVIEQCILESGDYVGILYDSTGVRTFTLDSANHVFKIELILEVGRREAQNHDTLTSSKIIDADYIEIGVPFRSSDTTTKIGSETSTVYIKDELYPPTTSLLTDVNITNIQDDQILTWDSGTQKWINEDIATTIEDLTDTNITSIQDNQILTWDSGTQKWINENPSAAGATELDDLTDVTITTPSSNDILSYNGSVWVNTTNTSGSATQLEQVTQPITYSRKLQGLYGCPSTNTVYIGDIEWLVSATDLFSTKTVTATTVYNASGGPYDGTYPLVPKLLNGGQAKADCAVLVHDQALQARFIVYFDVWEEDVPDSIKIYFTTDAAETAVGFQTYLIEASDRIGVNTVASDEASDITEYSSYTFEPNQVRTPMWVQFPTGTHITSNTVPFINPQIEIINLETVEWSGPEGFIQNIQFRIWNATGTELDETSFASTDTNVDDVVSDLFGGNFFGQDITPQTRPWRHAYVKLVANDGLVIDRAARRTNGETIIVNGEDVTSSLTDDEQSLLRTTATTFKVDTPGIYNFDAYVEVTGGTGLSKLRIVRVSAQGFVEYLSSEFTTKQLGETPQFYLDRGDVVGVHITEANTGDVLDKTSANNKFTVYKVGSVVTNSEITGYDGDLFLAQNPNVVMGQLDSAVQLYGNNLTLDFESTITATADQAVSLTGSTTITIAATTGATLASTGSSSDVTLSSGRDIDLTPDSDGKVLVTGVTTTTENVNVGKKLITEYDADLQTVPNIKRYTTFGSLGATSFKFGGGCLASNGFIYCTPLNEARVIKIDPVNESISFIGDTYAAGGAKWRGAVLAPNGTDIYCIPQQATQVLKIDTTDDTTSLIGTTYGTGSKWIGGCLAAVNGKIYGVPFDETKVLEIDPATDTTTLIGSTLSGVDKWAGGAYSPDTECIYCAMYSGDYILKIDPAAGTTSVLTGSILASGTSQFIGMVLAPSGAMYGIPYNSAKYFEFNPHDESGVFFGTAPGSAAFDSGLLGPDGNIYPMAFARSQFMEIDPRTNTAKEFPASDAGSNKYAGAVLAPNGKLFMIPANSASVGVMHIGDYPIPNWMLSAYVNKY